MPTKFSQTQIYEDASTDQPMEATMSYTRMSSHEVPRLYPGQRQFERRIDERTASDIGDALRADSVQAAALAMQHLQVDVQVALRVLAGSKEEPGKALRRTDAAASASG
jgi:hypothetical protein